MLQERLDAGAAVGNLVRLRRAERMADRRVRAEIEPVLAYLEDVVGSTVSRAEAARLLGVSHTALDRWIAKGEIAAVLTPEGRREVPLSQLVDLLEQVDQRREADGRLALASVIRDRRRRAEAIDTDELLPARRVRARGHRSAELRALVYHRLVARRLDEQIADDARRRLQRWRDDGLIDPRWAAEWQRILALPLRQVATLISADSAPGAALRQSSPFAGALTEQERRRVQQAVTESALV